MEQKWDVAWCLVSYAALLFIVAVVVAVMHTEPKEAVYWEPPQASHCASGKCPGSSVGFVETAKPFEVR